MGLSGRRREIVAAIAERYQIAYDDVIPAPAQGAVNEVYFLGNELVVRIPRGAGAPIAELAKEASVIPRARRAGVRTPAVVAYDPSRTLVDVPYLVLERVHARDLATLDVGPRQAARAYRAVGRTLAGLHRLRRSEVGSIGTPPLVEVDEGGEDPRVLVERLAVAGRIDVEQARWLIGWFDLLATRMPVDVEPVLIHGDVAPQNLLVRHNGAAAVLEFAALVDWGDAAWADPATEFAKVPLRAVPDMLAGYAEGGAGASGSGAGASGSGAGAWGSGSGASGRAAHGDGAHGDGVTEWSARVLWHYLHWALAGLEREPRREPRVWTGATHARLFEILRFFSEGPPEPWRRLAPRS